MFNHEYGHDDEEGKIVKNTYSNLIYLCEIAISYTCT